MKALKITKDFAQKAAQDFYEKLMSLDYIRGDKFSYSTAFPTQKKTGAVTVNFTYEAYCQMFALIDHFSSEVAWAGTVNRIDDTHFQVTKILLYPQKVTGVTVSTDDGEYAMWYAKLPDEDFYNLHFQGHSHVDMGVFPSTTDMEDQWRLIGNLPDNSYQIFMIWNKKRDYNVRVIDLKNNVIYEGEDVNVTVGDFDQSRFLEAADGIVKKTVTASAYGTTGNWTGGSYYGGRTTYNNTGTYGNNTVSDKPSINATNYTATSKENPGKKTVTGSAAPKVAPKKTGLARYYEEHPYELEEYGNSSCYPYYNN